MIEINGFKDFVKQCKENKFGAKILICNNSEFAYDDGSVYLVTTAKNWYIMLLKDGILHNITMNFNLFELRGRLVNLYYPRERELTKDENEVLEKANALDASLDKNEYLITRDYRYLTEAYYYKEDKNVVVEHTKKGKLKYQLLLSEWL